MRARDWGRRRWSLVLVAVAGAMAVLVVIVVAATTQGGGRHPSATAAASAPSSPVSNASEPEVTISSHASLTPIPRSFLGFSTEYWTLPVDEHHIALYRRLLYSVHVPGDGPLILRIGGDSSDHTIYDPSYAKKPNYAFALTHQFVDRTAHIVREMKLRLILDLNLITGSSALAGAWARYAERQMPRESILGFEVGNEPDLYDYAFWRTVTGDRRLIDGDQLPLTLSPAEYAKDFDAYSRVLAVAAPHVPLYAPALAYPWFHRRFITTLLAAPHPGLRVISGHRYPLAACTAKSSPQYPTIARVLGQGTTAGLAGYVRPAVQLAHRAGLPFVLTEFNSVTCGGLPGVSNTFATALWAPDAAFELLRTGAAGIHLHARQYAINDPFTFDRDGVVVRPLLYGLILFARTLGPNARLVPLRLHSDTAPHLKAWAVEVRGDILHVLLLNKGAITRRVALDLPATAPATVERLLAPSVRSSSNVTLGGQWLDSDARWEGRAARTVVVPAHNRYEVGLPGYSAALVTAHIRSGSLPGREG